MLHLRFFQAASLYERAVNAEETAERHALLAEALVQAERRNEALWHYERAANLYDDRQYKVGRGPIKFNCLVWNMARSRLTQITRKAVHMLGACCDRDQDSRNLRARYPGLS